MKKNWFPKNLNHRMKSHLSVDWMVTEWWLNADWIVTGKVDFSSISATIQWPFSRLNVRHAHISVTFSEKYNYARRNRTRVEKSKRKYANHSATGTVRQHDEYLVFFYRMFNSVHQTCFLNLLQLFYNHQLSFKR